MMLPFAWCILAVWAIVQVTAEVTVLRNAQYIYDKSPKLRIRGTGFEADDHDIKLELGVSGQDPLLVDKDYMITKDKDGDGLILKLLGNRRWADLTGRTPPVAILLSSVKFANDPEKNLLPDPVIIANVLNTPSVNPSDRVMYQSASNELRINGTGFIGSKAVKLYFKPSIEREIVYEDVSKYPLTKDQIVLRLRHGYKWREEPGTLLVLGVDTGGGPVKLGGDAGIQVADVKENLEFHEITVDEAPDLLLYADEAQLTISGSGFNPVGNTLRFSNQLAGNVNYTVAKVSETSMTLRLTPGSFWRKNFENLPGPLNLLAVNAGQGFVAVGPTNSGKGRDVAMIFERPQIFSDSKPIYRTHTHELHIKGSGFPLRTTDYKPKLKFSPELVEGTDYALKVVSRGELEVTLLDGRAWSTGAGDLLVTQINTRGDDLGWVKLPGDGIHVAVIKEDLDAKESGGIEVIPMGVKVYQSALSLPIKITGTGFHEKIAFEFDPPLKAGVDYELSFQSKNGVTLKLKSGKKWRSDAGFIVAKKVTNAEGKSFSLAGEDGIRVAVVLADPVITAGKESFHETQSKLIVISGSGFTNAADTKITLRPSSSEAYKVLGVLEDAIRLQLKPDQSWLPSYMGSLKDEPDSKKYGLVVTSINTGAGEITFSEPIVVGNIVKDREGVVCDDSCEFAFDGVCDDGSDPNDQYYYEHNTYQDDDLGGFYGEGSDTNGDGEKDTNEDGEADDDYYMANEDYQVSACVEGTDCTDCGGVDAIVDYTKPVEENSKVESCTNTCKYPRDGVCDDPRGTRYCELGTDCQDCGPVGAANFTAADDDEWWDDDDDYWSFNDEGFLQQVDGLEKNRHKVKTRARPVEESPAQMFLLVLEGMVYTVGAIFAAAALYLLNRWYKGQSVPFMNVFNPEMNRDFDSRPTQRMPITPDEFRT